MDELFIINNNLTQILTNNFDSSDSSSDESESEIINIAKNLLDDDNDENEILSALGELNGKRKRMCVKNYKDDFVAKYHETEFRSHFRIATSLFNSLVEKFESSEMFRAMHDNGRRISASRHVAIFLWFAGHEGCCMRDLAERFDASLSSVNRVVKRMTQFFSSMSSQVIVWPDDELKEENSRYFEDICGMPKVIGCIDGTHINIDPPTYRKDDYIDREGNVSLCLQAICDHRRKFISIFVEPPGSWHDSWVFEDSPIYQNLDSSCGDYYLIGDSAYPCLSNLMTPYKDNGHLTASQKYFNMKLGSARVLIEHSFGILKQRFRQLYHCKLKGVAYLCDFIKACCVLHNISNENDLDFLLEETESNMPNDFDFENHSNKKGNLTRDLLCAHLSGDNI